MIRFGSTACSMFNRIVRRRRDVLDEHVENAHIRSMDDKRPNLLDPDFEPTDDQLKGIAQAALKLVRKRSAAVGAAGDPASGGMFKRTASLAKKKGIAKRKSRLSARRRTKVPA